MAEETRTYGAGPPAKARADEPPIGLADTEIAPTVMAPPRSQPADAAGAVAVSTQPVAVELEAGTQVGEYRVGRKLGEGGMGAVYAGEQPTIGKRVAIKVLAPHSAGNPELVRRFVEEARAANRIHNPYIIDIFSFGQLPDGRHYFVMEFLDGESLADAIEQGHVSSAEIRRLLRQICNALEATHKVGIVHRDLKPENIWIARPPNGESYVKLLDFGIAKLLDPARTSLTQTGAVMGTPLFMSPEQCMGREVDARTDIYALGVLLYRIFTGRYPFDGTVFTELMVKHATVAPPPPSSIRPLPAELERIILDCLAKDPASRPASAQALGERLQTVLSAGSDSSAGVTAAVVTGRTVPGVARVVPVTETQVQARGSRRAGTALLALGVVAEAGIGAAVLFTRARVQQPAARLVEPTRAAPGIAAPATGRANVTIENGADSRVLLDGREVARGQARVELADLAAGTTHRLQVEAPGRQRIEKEFVVSGGATIEIPIALQAEARPAQVGRASGKSRAGGSRRGESAPAAMLPTEAPVVAPAAALHAQPPEPTETSHKPPEPKKPTRAAERGLLDENPLR